MAVASRTIAIEFAADGGAVAAEGSGDLRLVEPLPSECSKHISFTGGELAIRHGEYPLRRG